MERIENIAQTYSQAPWRKQLQMIGLFSLVLVFIALVAGIYLSVSARSAAAGREIQSMQRKIEELDQKIEDSQSQLATMMSSGEMEKRAHSLGFTMVNTDEISFIAVPGYITSQPTVLAPYESRSVTSAPVTLHEYTESLFEWFNRQFKQWSYSIIGADLP